jgi:hypothetical protein
MRLVRSWEDVVFSVNADIMKAGMGASDVSMELRVLGTTKGVSGHDEGGRDVEQKRVRRREAASVGSRSSRASDDGLGALLQSTEYGV